jgi:hypothetical protein
MKKISLVFILSILIFSFALFSLPLGLIDSPTHAQTWSCTNLGVTEVICRAQPINSCSIFGCELPAEADEFCETYYEENGVCPTDSVQLCDCPETTITPIITPIPTVIPTPLENTPTPTPATCGDLGEDCCGTIPPVTCNWPYLPSDPESPYSCICNNPPPGVTPPLACGDLHQPCCQPPVSDTIGYQCDPSKDLEVDYVEGVCICISIHAPEVPANLLCNGGSGINTAIGCIPVQNTQELTKFLLSWGLGIAGGIALLLITYAGFLIMTSQGNPQRLQAGKELLTAALSGLLLIIFSATLLRLIGVDILGIPGFGQN